MKSGVDRGARAHPASCQTVYMVIDR